MKILSYRGPGVVWNTWELVNGRVKIIIAQNGPPLIMFTDVWRKAESMGFFALDCFWLLDAPEHVTEFMNASSRS